MSAKWAKTRTRSRWWSHRTPITCTPKRGSRECQTVDNATGPAVTSQSGGTAHARSILVTAPAAVAQPPRVIRSQHAGSGRWVPSRAGVGIQAHSVIAQGVARSHDRMSLES